MRQHLFPKYFGYRFASSPIADWLRDFDQWLAAGSYCTPIRRRHVAIVRHVLERHSDLPTDRRFDADDLNRMFNSPVRPRAFSHARTAFERYLRGRNCWIAAPVEDGPHRALLDAYATHMCELQGLAASTAARKLEIAQSVLAACCPPPRTPADLTAHDIERFVARLVRGRARSTAIGAVSYLRSFVRFCHARGLCPSGLDKIDRPRQYRGEKPPRAIPWELSQRFLDSIDRTDRVGCRDHAALHLMAHYGLRTGEVADLDVKDVDLTGKVLDVAQAKIRTTFKVPLSTKTVRILSHYLRHGRPRSNHPALFLTVTAPLTRFRTQAIGAAFARHAHRSGLPLTEQSPYGLRHGFAMRLFDRGVGIKTIGDLLGHHCLESTSVYLRLDTDKLREVALAVPSRAARERRPS